MDFAFVLICARTINIHVAAQIFRSHLHLCFLTPDPNNYPQMSVIQFVTIFLLGVAPALAATSPIFKNNPIGTVAVADFPSAGTYPITKGYVYFYSPKGKEVHVHLDMTGLPKIGGPFVYHIHENAISDDNCETAGLHFNPYGADPNCDSQDDLSLCQVGDLSGKHGPINATCFATTYVDPFLSLNDSVNGIVGKSVVFHYGDLTKFACATIQLADDEQMERFNALNSTDKNQHDDIDREWVEWTESRLTFESSSIETHSETQSEAYSIETYSTEAYSTETHPTEPYPTEHFSTEPYPTELSSTEPSYAEPFSTEMYSTEMYSSDTYSSETHWSKSIADESDPIECDPIESDPIESDPAEFDPVESIATNSTEDEYTPTESTNSSATQELDCQNCTDHGNDSKWNGTRLSYESCSSEAQAATIQGGVGMMIGALFGALL